MMPSRYRAFIVLVSKQLSLANNLSNKEKSENLYADKTFLNGLTDFHVQELSATEKGKKLLHFLLGLIKLESLRRPKIMAHVEFFNKLSGNFGVVDYRALPRYGNKY